MMLGQSLKDSGQAQVLRTCETWTHDAMAAMKAYCHFGGPDWLFAIEDFRHWASVHHCLMEPKRPNAWGAFASRCARAGLIEFTGLYRHAKSPKTRCHDVKIWKVAK